MTTRAIRRYSGESVSDEEVARCLAAAQQAPSGGNSQPWQYLVVTDFDLKVRVAWIYRTAYERWEKAQLSQLPPGWSDAQRQEFDRGLKASRTLAEGLESAAALVLFLMPDVSITPSDDEGPIDIGPLYASVYPAVQNFMLAARSLGIGTVLTTVWWSRQADMRELLGIPDRFEIVALVPLGRPVGRFGKAARRDAATVTHWNGYGSKRT
ncbi:MAG: nitroreductase family protein [Acidimicrobiia bacterium]|nr:nitroreductase family protein [Acidimicrobiia bacterium]MDH4307030.1 nitroreductase family protein [Acidimicrobiia bacterium]MDH5293205.1 nitroreductase family protein [Acidimicrobiia bacterium]